MRFSIITVTKNNKAGLIRAIECVRNQTYKNVEHIIVDGGSTDGSVEILRQAQNDTLRHFDPSTSSGQAQGDSMSNVILNEMKDLHSPIDSSPTAQNDNREMDSGQAGMTDSKLRRNDYDSTNSIPPTTNYQLITISEPDEGIYDAINKGIKLATGDVIGLLHSDDLYADENVIEKYASAFDQPTTNNQLQTIEAVYSDLVYVRKKREARSERIGADSRQAGMTDSKQVGMTDRSTTNDSLPTTYSVIRYWKAHKALNSNQPPVKSKDTDHRSLVTDHLLRKGWMPPHPTLFIRREIFGKYGLYNTDLKIASDYEMILRLFYKNKITSCYLPLTTYLMTTGGASNKNIGNILLKSKEDHLAMKLNGIRCPLFTLANKNLRKLPQFLVRSL